MRGYASNPRRAYVTLCAVRFLGFFILVFALLFVLRGIPVIGAVFQIPLIGFFLAAAIVSTIAARVGTGVVASRKHASEVERLGAVDTPYNQGKLGQLLEKSGKPKQAIAPLEAAIRGEPEVVEWHYRLGRAQLALGNLDEAVEHLEDARELDEEHAYGQVLLSLAEALRARGDDSFALQALERFELLQGPTPESAFRRGQVLARLKQKQRARAAFDEVGRLAREQPGYQRASGRRWASKALFAKLLA